MFINVAVYQYTVYVSMQYALKVFIKDLDAYHTIHHAAGVSRENVLQEKNGDIGQCVDSDMYTTYFVP